MLKIAVQTKELNGEITYWSGEGYVTMSINQNCPEENELWIIDEDDEVTEYFNLNKVITVTISKE
jgi:hypothetical protein